MLECDIAGSRNIFPLKLYQEKRFLDYSMSEKRKTDKSYLSKISALRKLTCLQELDFIIFDFKKSSRKLISPVQRVAGIP